MGIAGPARPAARLAALAALACIACAKHGAAPAPAASASTPLAASGAASAAPRHAPTNACGDGCRLFDTPEAAFKAVLADKPRVLAIGETHAQQGSETIESATKRFTTALLPLVKGTAADLVLELWFADPKCAKKKVKQVAKQQKAVTKHQAKRDQNEFIALGDAAKAMGIQPHVLTPACKEYDAIIKAGDNDVATMLDMIGRLTRQDIEILLDRQQKSGKPSLVLAYGGAMHNDLHPRPGFESFSFGPAVSQRTAGRYVELDLIVPEFVKDTPAWKSLAWYPHYDPAAHPDKTTLIETAKGSYALIFPRTR